MSIDICETCGNQVDTDEHDCSEGEEEWISTHII